METLCCENPHCAGKCSLYRIQGCLFHCAPDTPRPGIDYKIRYTKQHKAGSLTLGERNERYPTPLASKIRYLQWYDRKNGPLQKINPDNIRIRKIKDPETGYVKQLTIIYNEKWCSMKRGYIFDKITVDIPYWNYDPSYTEITDEAFI